MPPQTSWTESKLASLGSDEYTYKEYKSSQILFQNNLLSSHFASIISKQLSAFANGSGGHIFIGINDDGEIDGGVPIHLKNGTRSWLEDTLPNAVFPRLSALDIYEVTGSLGDPEDPSRQHKSKILPGHAVYVIEVGSSPHAPHQANDYRFYLRIAGKSRPMGPVHIQDVFRRTYSPEVTMLRVGPYGEPEYIVDEYGACVFLRFQLFIANEGRQLAQHVGTEMILPRPMVIRSVRERMGAQPNVVISQSPGEVTFFRYHDAPLFPRQEIKSMRIWAAIHQDNAEAIRAGAMLRWRIFADNALPRSGSTPLQRFGVVVKALNWIQKQSSKTPDAAKQGD